MNHPWGVTTEVNLSRFGAVANLDWYRKIYAFLSDEAKVSARLQQLSAANPATVEAFTAQLAAIEAANGFSGEVARLEKVVDGDVFLAQIMAKRPLLDLGVTVEHGALTHRIQWAIIAMDFASSLPGGLTVAGLYAGLAHANCHVPKIPGEYKIKEPLTLWDVLVDGPYTTAVAKKYWVYNGRSPEYLIAYMLRHPSPGMKRIAEFSTRLSHDFIFPNK